MTGLQALKGLHDNLMKDANALRLQIGGGGCSTFEAYKHECGKVKGLEAAAAAVEAEMKKYNQEDE